MAIDAIEADVTQLEVDGIANAANTALAHGGSGLERVVFALHGSETVSAFDSALAS